MYLNVSAYINKMLLIKFLQSSLKNLFSVFSTRRMQEKVQLKLSER